MTAKEKKKKENTCLCWEDSTHHDDNSAGWAESTHNDHSAASAVDSTQHDDSTTTATLAAGAMPDELVGALLEDNDSTTSPTAATGQRGSRSSATQTLASSSQADAGE